MEKEKHNQVFFCADLIKFAFPFPHDAREKNILEALKPQTSANTKSLDLHFLPLNA